MHSSRDARLEPLEPRRLMAGDLVATFAADGTIALPQNPTHVFTQRDGRIVVVRTTHDGATTPYIRRFLPDGTPDGSFPHAALIEQLDARLGDVGNVTMDDHDRLLVSGGMKLARVTPGGRIDPTFGKRGVIHLAYNPREIAVLEHGGAIVTTGEITRGGDELFFGTHYLTLLTPDGRIDTRFDGDGTIETAHTSRDDPFSGPLMYASAIENEQIVSLPDGRFLYLRQMSVSGAQGPTNAIGGGVFHLADGSIDTSFTFDRTDVLPQEFTHRFVAGEGLSNDGRLLDAARALPDGSVQFVFSPDALDPARTQTATLTPDGTITNVRDLSDDFLSPIRDPQTGALYLPNAQGTSITRYTTAGVEEQTFNVTVPDPGGAWVPFGFASDGNLIATYHDVDMNPILLGKIHATDAPTGSFWGGPSRRERGSAYRFTVTWDDPDGIDVSTLASRAIVVDLPDGSTRTAVFESADPSSNADTVVATYHLRAPDGVWQAADNGRYQVRLRGKHVADTTGQRATGRVMGQFYVDIPTTAGAAAPAIAAPAALVVDVASLLEEQEREFA